MGQAKDENGLGGETRRGRRAAAAKGVSDRFVKGMVNPLRIQVWTILTERAGSAKEIADAIEAPFEKVNYEMRELFKLGVLELIEEVPVRGAIKKIYRAVTRARLDENEWLEVPEAVKDDLRATLLRSITDDAIEAIAAGQYDSRSDAHMSWVPMLLDEQGCAEAAQILLRALDEILDYVQPSSMERLRTADAEGISYTVSILGYTSAHERSKVGPPLSAREFVRELSEARTRKREPKPGGKDIDAVTGGEDES